MVVAADYVKITADRAWLLTARPCGKRQQNAAAPQASIRGENDFRCFNDDPSFHAVPETQIVDSVYRDCGRDGVAASDVQLDLCGNSAFLTRITSPLSLSRARGFNIDSLSQVVFGCPDMNESSWRADAAD